MQLLLFINHHTTNALFDILMPALSLQGYLLVVPFLLFILAQASVTKNDRGKTYLVAAVWTILIACCAAYLAGRFEDWMKDAVARVRPCRAIEGIRLILPCPRSYSMPSGHAISSFAFALPLWYMTRPYIPAVGRWYPIVLASLISFSRLYLGVHYPTDVLVGALAGGAIGLGLSILYQTIANEEFVKKYRHRVW